MLRFSPAIFEPLFCWVFKIPQNCRQISRDISPPPPKKITDELLQERRETFFDIFGHFSTICHGSLSLGCPTYALCNLTGHTFPLNAFPSKKSFFFIISVPLRLGGRFGIFLLLGGGERGVQGAGRGWEDIFVENPRKGSPRRVGTGGSRGREGVCGEFGGGELNIFLRGRNSRQVDYIAIGDTISCDALGSHWPFRGQFSLNVKMSGKKTLEMGSGNPGHPGLEKSRTLTLQPLLFSISLLFSFSDLPCFFVRFCSLFQGF